VTFLIGRTGKIKKNLATVQPEEHAADRKKCCGAPLVITVLEGYVQHHLGVGPAFSSSWLLRGRKEQPLAASIKLISLQAVTFVVQ